MTNLGQWLIEEECRHIGNLIPAGYYPSALQVGFPNRDFLKGLDTVEVGTRYLAIPDIEPLSSTEEGMKMGGFEEPPGVTIAHPGALPFGDKAHSLIVLPHVLDFCSNPHDVLREINQTLIPEGCVVITGFNPLSLWGMQRFLFRGRLRRFSSLSLDGQYYRAGRVQDWLSLLGFDIVGATMMAYLLPLQNSQWRDKFGFLEQMGDRWWPGLGGVYLIVGRKREVASGSSGHRLAWRRFIPAIARPAVTASEVPSGNAGVNRENRMSLVVDNLN